MSLDSEKRPSQELIAAFNGFQRCSTGYEAVKEEVLCPGAMGGSQRTRYTLKNRVVVERLWDPVKRSGDEFIQFAVQLPAGEYHCFFKAHEQKK